MFFMSYVIPLATLQQVTLIAVLMQYDAIFIYEHPVVLWFVCKIRKRIDFSQIILNTNFYLTNSCSIWQVKKSSKQYPYKLQRYVAWKGHIVWKGCVLCTSNKSHEEMTDRNMSGKTPVSSENHPYSFFRHERDYEFDANHSAILPINIFSEIGVFESSQIMDQYDLDVNIAQL